MQTRWNNMKMIHRWFIAAFAGLIILLLLVVWFKQQLNVRVERALEQRAAERTSPIVEVVQEQEPVEVQENQQFDGENYEPEPTEEIGSGSEQGEGQASPGDEVLESDLEKEQEPQLEREDKDEPEPVGQSEEDALAVKERISQTYLTELDSLQSNCESEGSRIVAQIATAMKEAKADGNEVSMEKLQGTYLLILLEAEARCDHEFQTLLAAAEQEYLEAEMDAGELQEWQLRYIKAKNQARDKAIDQLSRL